MQSQFNAFDVHLQCRILSEIHPPTLIYELQAHAQTQTDTPKGGPTGRQPQTGQINAE